MNKKVLVAFVPVLHQGYLNFFNKYCGADLYILGKDITDEYKPLTKEIRALEPDLMKSIIKGLGIFDKVFIATKETLRELAKKNAGIIFPNEDVMRDISERYWPNKKTVSESIFLRFDKFRSTEEEAVDIDQKISIEEFDKKVIRDLSARAERMSSDVWRRVGAAIIRDGEIIVSTYNKHVPSEQTPFVFGDPRSNFSRGVCIELSTAFHAEARLITEAAKMGIATEGMDMYVSTFPCPPCAKLIAYSGIKRLFYAGGYSMLEGAELIKGRGMEIIYVDLSNKKKNA